MKESQQLASSEAQAILLHISDTGITGAEPLSLSVLSSDLAFNLSSSKYWGP